MDHVFFLLDKRNHQSINVKGKVESPKHISIISPKYLANRQDICYNDVDQVSSEKEFANAGIKQS